jgi:putative flavoprotein involved in K+ transport
MKVPSTIETVVVGAGHAGLIMSWVLREAGRDHVVLERRTTLGGGWQDRWDGFGLVTPNWTTSFPGQPYDALDPDGYMSRDEIIGRVAGYADRIGAPVALDAPVRRMTIRDGGGFRLETSQGDIDAKQVIVATGSFHTPRVPAFGMALPSRLAQLHSHAYKNESLLPPGAVLIVGSGQSGVQIAEELSEAGRRICLSVGSAGRVPRRYRGRDFIHWLVAVASRGARYGLGLPTVDQLADPRLRSAGNVQLSGHHGGHDINLRQFAAAGMKLLGRIERVDDERLYLAADLSSNLARADRFFDERFRGLVDRYIERAGIEAPPDDRQPYAYEPPEPAEIDLDKEGISTVIWTTGFGLDFRWIDLPILDEQGFPRHTRGVTEAPGLYFLGLLWQHTQASATLFGPSLDVPHLAAHMGVPIREGSFPVVP